MRKRRPGAEFAAKARAAANPGGSLLKAGLSAAGPGLENALIKISAGFYQYIIMAVLAMATFASS